MESTQMEKRLTLQRRVKSGSVEKSTVSGSTMPGAENSVFDAEGKYKIALKPGISNNDTHDIKLSCKLAEGQQVTKLNSKSHSKDVFGNVENDGCMHSKCRTGTADARFPKEVPVSEQLPTSKYVNQVSGEQLHEKGDIKRMAGKQRLQQLKHSSLERPRTPTKASTEGFKLTPKNSAFQVKSSLSASGKQTADLPTVSEKKTSSPPGGGSAKADEDAETLAGSDSTEKDTFKVENSKVTVAELGLHFFIFVFVFALPFRERNESLLPVVSMSGSETSVRNPSTNQLYNFSYDFSFWSFDKCHPNFASQEMIYKTLALPLLERAFEGYNACLFAYGQTGSGKSYTMMGFDEDRGIIPRLCEDLFTRIAQTDQQQVLYHLEMSYFEVYNEKIHDLLVFKAESRQKKQPECCQFLLRYPVLEFFQTNSVDEEQCDHRLTSHVNLIDLAGSECCSTAQTTGERLKEGVSINKSLLTLGKVISALSKLSRNGKKTFIPYRESVLTWLLKESLGGNSQTAMIATISPAASNTEETLSTLRYAKQACSIINMAKVNEDVNAKLIRELRAEIEKLKAAQKSAQNRDPEKYRHYLQEITSLRIKLHRQERDMTEMQRAWKAKLEQAEKRKLEDIKELQKAGIAFQMDNRLPNLVNLNEDPQLSEVLLYMIKEGETTVGRYTANSKHDIQLSGVLIADDHCVIKNTTGQVSIIPRREAKTYVNGKCIVNPTVLHHGDRVILGGDHYFRFNHPVEVQKVKGLSCGTTLLHDGPKDFEFAKNELLIAQRAQLESEIEEARIKAKEEMMQSVQIAKEMVQQELTSQKEAYESKIKSLEAEVREESRKNQVQELNNQKAASKIQELEKAKQNLELELQFNKKRLEMEALATKQVFIKQNSKVSRWQTFVL
ncbi:hypothetical protein CIB84_008369 [Bambusicola thoracicus]|uniref:Kinesin-like protein n=1 Tax=Bambusicola thoracicus TaxID=9083 RepID=A0A2P4SUU1_BAMTH|nr:hypothetical protein CIB84_008369 [Bambusicola thoracicus]